MKKRHWIFVLMLLYGIGSSACSDDDEGTIAGSISFYGEEFLLEQGAVYRDNNHAVIAVEDYVFEDSYETENGLKKDDVKGFCAAMTDGQTGNFLVGLYEHGFVLSDVTKGARGSGACICLRLASPDVEKLVPGKYVYSKSREAYTFVGYSSVNFDSPKVIPNELTEGVVNVDCQGEIYTITFDCKTSFGAEVKGNYVGVLKAFDIRKNAESINSKEDIKLEALFDKVNYTDLEGVDHSEPDYFRAYSFYASSNKTTYSANIYRNLSESEKKNIDIALAYDTLTETVRFESPIKMRALLWHNMYKNETLFNYTFDLPCHTKYMLAPEEFTDEDFDALKEIGDFNVDFSETIVSIPVNSLEPYFVFVQTGNGELGCIRVKKVVPATTEMIEGVIYPVNPYILMDIKFPRSYSEQKLR